jgi:hypothetical protein
MRFVARARSNQHQTGPGGFFFREIIQHQEAITPSCERGNKKRKSKNANGEYKFVKSFTVCP